MPRGREDLPGTLKRSPKHAQDTYREALASAHDEYHDEERAHRVAYAALKHSYEKVGDHWEKKSRKGPSDRKAAGGRNSPGKTAGGVDVKGHTRDELYERARKLGVRGRSHMTKAQLGRAIARKQD